MSHARRRLSVASSPLPLQGLLRPFQAFACLESGSGILLLLCTGLALLWANSAWSRSYTDLWATHFSLGIGGQVLSKPLLLWINDFLMAIFFFVVGLEIKREVLVGELSTLAKATLPLVAAVGGMVVPAALYVAVNRGGLEMRGWGVPMATDIAFALGVLALLGSRAPTVLKVFLTAFAIADDVGAVLVIALFYTDQIAWSSLAVGALLLLTLAALNIAGVRRPLPYALLGLALWLAFLKSGVHATVAGVLLAWTIPARTRINADQFLARSRCVLDQFDRADIGARDRAAEEERQAALHTQEQLCEAAQTPLHRLEHALLPWVKYLIMPVFVLANAGVTLAGGEAGGVLHPVSLGIVLGLVVGKPLGITLFAWAAVRLGVAALPEGISWRHIHGAAWLGGIGFTMALFIAGLAFAGTPLGATAKIGILAASLISGIVGFGLLARVPLEAVPASQQPAPGQ